ncbi:MAG: PTS sugar transporter subunit IIA [Planctomycetes bacterium]|nr:PTS sugar transporter subunit IIA [Planctomycetota bacterium]
MRLSELFRAEDLLIGFRPSDKWDAIQQLVDHLVGQGRLPGAQAGAIRDAVVARERSMSTGMEQGIAIPHAAVDGVESVVACMGIVGSDSGLSFDSIDGKPTRIVVLLVIPRAETAAHPHTGRHRARARPRRGARIAGELGGREGRLGRARRGRRRAPLSASLR